MAEGPDGKRFTFAEPVYREKVLCKSSFYKESDGGIKSSDKVTVSKLGDSLTDPVRKAFFVERYSIAK